jgi:hypothetical protein
VNVHRREFDPALNAMLLAASLNCAPIDEHLAAGLGVFAADSQSGLSVSSDQGTPIRVVAG